MTLTRSDGSTIVVAAQLIEPFDVSVVGVLLVNDDQQVLAANTRAAELFGCTHDELLARRLADFAPDTAGAANGWIASWTGDRRLHLAGGRRVDVDATVHPVPADPTLRLVQLLDTTALHVAAAAVAKSESRYRQLAANLPHASVQLFDIDKRILVTGGGALRDIGFHTDDAEGQTLGQVVPEAVRAVLEPFYDAALAGVELDATYVAPLTGREYQTRTRPVRDEAGEVVGGLVVSEDVTEQRASARAALQTGTFSAAVLAACPDTLAVIHLSSGDVGWASRLLDADGSSAVTSLFDLVHPDDADRLKASLRNVSGVADGQVTHVRYRQVLGDDSVRWVSQRITPFGREADGRAVTGIAALRDVTEEVWAEERLAHAGEHDPLTGLPNRRLLSARMQQVLGSGHAARDGLAILFIDLDGFKHVNDGAGHVVGDAVLVEAAERISEVLRPGQTLTRVGGDEFVVLIEHRRPDSVVPHQRAPHVSARTSALAVDAEAVATRIGAALRAPFFVAGREFALSASIGVAVAGADATPDELLRDADAAMYQAKREGKGRHSVVNQQLRSELVRRDDVERALRAALSPTADSSRLYVAYQPIVNLRSGDLDAVEALLRLVDDDGEPFPASTVVDVAEQCGLVEQLGAQVLATACGDLAAWRVDPDLASVSLAVNLSSLQLRLNDLAGLVRRTLVVHRLQPTDLVLELTESELLDADPVTLGQLRELREVGVRVVIDDFGTGYASLRNLVTLPISGVKVDRSFVGGVPDDRKSATIVRSIASLAHELGLTCVAEGIETYRQLAALPDGVDGQGFLISPPVRAVHVPGLAANGQGVATAS